MAKRQDGHGHDDHSAHGIEPHDQAAAIFAVDEHSGEGKHEHGGNGLQDGEGAQRHFRVRGLQDVPGHGGRFIPLPNMEITLAAKTKRSGRLAENSAHLSTLAEEWSMC